MSAQSCMLRCMESALADYIRKVRWQFAYTMPDRPHEYTVKAWRPDLHESFEEACRVIAMLGRGRHHPSKRSTAITTT